MSLPSSVVHYTSVDVLSILLNGALTSSSGDIVFHLSQLAMMNDSGEGKYLLDRFYTNSLHKTALKQDWDKNYYPTHIPFILSTIATNKDTRNRGSLPMWKMYGDDCRGALIRFDRLKLEKYCKTKKLKFLQCKYRTVQEVNALVADFNKEEVEFDKLMLESCITKQMCWNYENEWRIIAYSSKENIKTKSTSRGLVEYIELALPIDLIEEICLGPLCDKDNTFQSLSLMKDKLIDKHGDKMHFKISQSTISLK